MFNLEVAYLCEWTLCWNAKLPVDSLVETTTWQTNAKITFGDDRVEIGIENAAANLQRQKK